MCGDTFGLLMRTIRITGDDLLHKFCYVLFIGPLMNDGCPFPCEEPPLLVTETFRLGFFEGSWFDQQSLAFISSPCTAEPHDNRTQV